MGIFDTHSMRYISHRGFRPLAPDNSLPGFEYAGMLGQWAIETDVHVTADGVLVCNHNDTVDESYNGTGCINDMKWQELSKLRLRCGTRVECLKDEQKRMPLFSEYLEICKKHGSIPFIEIKTAPAQLVMEAVRKAGFADSGVVVSSIKICHLEETRKYSREVFIHWIFADESRLETLCRAGNAGLSWNIPNCYECPAEKISLAHEMGLKVCLRAGDTQKDVQYMQSIGLDYIPTNCMHG